MSSEDASAAPKRQRGACTAQPQREKTLYHNVAECQAESKNGSGTGQPEREKILSQGDRIVKPHKNVHKLHAAALGNETAVYQLGKIYSSGEASQEDYLKAIQLLEQTKGVLKPWAEYKIGTIYQDERFSQKDLRNL